MKAVLIHGYDTAPILTEVARPVPGAGEVLVRVRAAALNPLDVKLRRGFMHQFFPLKFPYALGTDIAGEIEDPALFFFARWAGEEHKDLMPRPATKSHPEITPAEALQNAS